VISTSTGIRALSAVLLAGSAIVSGTALAQDVAPQAAAPQSGTLDTEIVVTAQRRNERQVDVPIAITALGAQQLQTANVQNLPDIQRITPSLRFDNQAAFVQPTIRGIGTGITTSGGGSNVGIYIDGFYSPNPIAADFQLTKVDSIQVLKGPQGTLFGHNTTGGAILITTAEPSEDPEIDLKASYGSFEAKKVQGYGTFALAKGVAMDVEGVFQQGDGFITNIVDGNGHVGKYKNWTVRTGIKADISDAVSVLARYQHSDLNDPSGMLTDSNTDTTIDPTTGKPFGVQTFTVPGTYTTSPDEVAENAKQLIQTKTDIAQLTIKADLGFANLTSYTQYRRENTNQSEDLDHTALPIFELGLPIFDRTWSQEFLLTSKPGPRLQWTTGFFYFSNKDTYVTYFDPGSFGGVNPFTGGPLDTRTRLGGSSSTTKSFAGFADATYQITDKLFLTAGLRFSHDEVVDAYYNSPAIPPFDPAFQHPVPGISSNHVTPRVVLRYKPTDQSSIYASFTKGYKAAIIDVGGSCQDGPPAGNFTCNPVKPESIYAYEVGYKYADRRLSFEVSGFYYDYKNLQVSEFLGNAQAFIINAAKSQIYGLDGEIHYKFGDHVQLNAGGAWTHARYKQFGGQSVNGQTVGAPIYATCPTSAAGLAGLAPSYQAACAQGGYVYVNTDTVLRNVHMQHVPDFTATIGPRVTTGMTDKGELALSGSLYYTSFFYFSPSGTQFKQPGYATVDLRLQWDDPTKKYFLAAYGTNVTDKRYRTQVQYNSYGIGATWNQPASWGIEAGAKF
jgi:iron complex outermembrane receptor protein